MCYTCYFMGSCLVLHISRASGKEITRCIKFELQPRKWHHVALSFVYSRWAKSEIHCFIDGNLVESIEASWLISTNEYFDRCFIGCGLEMDATQAFCGQLGAIYLFSQAISAQQANSLYCLGPNYQSHFKHDAESQLPEPYKKHLFDGRLNANLIFAYCPKNCHGQLCLFPKNKLTPTYFIQVPHAVCVIYVISSVSFIYLDYARWCRGHNNSFNPQFPQFRRRYSNASSSICSNRFATWRPRNW